MSYANFFVGRIHVLGAQTLTAGPYPDDAAATSKTVSHTVVAGTERLLVRTHGITGSTTMPAETPTFNGVSMTMRCGEASIYNQMAAVWELANPPVGAFNLVLPHLATQYRRGIATNLANLHQTTFVRQSVAIDDEAGVLDGEVSVTSAVGDAVFAVTGTNDRNIGNAIGDVVTDFPYVSAGGKPGYGERTAGLATATLLLSGTNTGYGCIAAVSYIPRALDRTVSGTVTYLGSPVSGANVRLINQTLGTVRSTTTNASGVYSFTVEAGYLYHAVAEVVVSAQRYHYRSLFDLTPSV